MLYCGLSPYSDKINARTVIAGKRKLKLPRPRVIEYLCYDTVE